MSVLRENFLCQGKNPLLSWDAETYGSEHET